MRVYVRQYLRVSARMRVYVCMCVQVYVCKCEYVRAFASVYLSERVLLKYCFIRIFCVVV